MYDHYQLEIPESFKVHYLVPGRLRPTASRNVIAGRYELCEDLANHLFEYASAQLHDLGITASDVLVRCFLGMVGEPSTVTEPEAVWVVRRLAELEGWECPALPAQT